MLISGWNFYIEGQSGWQLLLHINIQLQQLLLGGNWTILSDMANLVSHKFAGVKK